MYDMGFMLGAIAGVAAGYLICWWIDPRLKSKLELRPGPKPTLSQWMKVDEQSTDYILTLADGRQYRGDCTVWYSWPDGHRAGTGMESFLCEKWKVIKWKEEERDR